MAPSAMNAFPAVRAVSFDVGGTLLEPWPSVGHVYAAVARETGLATCDPIELNARFAAAWRAKDHFDYSRAAWADLVVNTFQGTAAQHGLASELFQRLYERFAEADAWKLHEDALPTLNALAPAGFKLAVISNWDERLRTLLGNLDLDKYFQVIVVSAECGFQKPAVEVFQTAAHALGMRPGEILHVGDSYREDYRGAQEAGLASVLLERRGAEAGPERIRSLREIEVREGVLGVWGRGVSGDERV
jgi:putative hydrolase of the HAD superfamily